MICWILIHQVNDHYKSISISNFILLLYEIMTNLWENSKKILSILFFFLWHLPISVYRYVAERVLDELFNSIHLSSGVSTWHSASVTHLFSPISGPHPRRFLRYTPSPIKNITRTVVIEFQCILLQSLTFRTLVYIHFQKSPLQFFENYIYIS